jgi:hypothetical protein
LYFNDSFPVWVSVLSVCFFFPLLDDMMQKYAGSGNEGDFYAEAFEVSTYVVYFRIGICIQTQTLQLSSLFTIDFAMYTHDMRL